MDQENGTGDSREDNLFDRIDGAPAYFQSHRLRRSGNNVIVAGVCSGIADYLKADPADIRLVMLLSLLIGIWSVVVYFLLALLLPVDLERGQLDEEKERARREENFILLLSGFLILTGIYSSLRKFGLVPDRSLSFYPGGVFAPLFSLVIGLYFFIRSGTIYLPGKTGKPEFVRIRRGGILLGVCGGLAGYLDVDAVFLLIIFIFSLIPTMGLFAIVYLLLGYFSQYERENADEI